MFATCRALLATTPLRDDRCFSGLAYRKRFEKKAGILQGLAESYHIGLQLGCGAELCNPRSI